MPRLERFLIMSFNNPPKPTYEITVPQNAVFLNRVKIFHDGIYGFYHLTESLLTRVDTFKVLQPDEVVPCFYELVEILDVITELGTEEEPNQGIMLFPIYKYT